MLKNRQSKTTNEKEVFELPTEPIPPEEDLENFTLALYGEPKIGKTSFVAEFKNPMFLMFEPGGKGLNIKRVQMTSWAGYATKTAPNGEVSCSLQKAVELIVKNPYIQTVVIDTADLAYESCTDHIVSEANEEGVNEGSLSYGKGVDKVDAEFKKQILRLTSSGRGVVFISHAAVKDFQESTGAKYEKIIPSMKDRARRFINGFADMIFYYGYFGDDRYLIIKGSDKVDAGHRIPEHFLTTKGEPIHAVPMGNSPAEGYENLVTAFNNEQTDPQILKRKAELGERKAKFSGRKQG